MSLAQKTPGAVPRSAFDQQTSTTGQFAFDGPRVPDTALTGIEPIYRITRGSESAGSSSPATKPRLAPAEQNDSARVGEGVAKGLMMLKAAPLPPHRFRSLQAWEGTVNLVGATMFTARLFDRARPGEEEAAEFELSEISEDDRPLVVAGSVFYWDVGYLDTPGGRRCASEIRFRRLPAWTREELEVARREAAEFRELVGWK